MQLNLQNSLLDENTGDLGEGGGGTQAPIESESPELESLEPGAEAASPWEEPLGSLRESVTAMEGRFGEQLSPLQTQLKEVQESLGRQTAVEVPDDKLAAIEAWATKYDPKLEGLGDLLKELITASVQSTPLDGAALRPHLDEFGGQLRYETATNWLSDVVSPQLGFDQDQLVNEADPQSPATDLQRAWLQFWQTTSAAQRQALTTQRQDGSVAHPREFGQAMLAFDRKWKKLSQEKNESAGGASRRLAGATQTSSSGRSSPSSSQLRTEEDGFADYFKRKAS